MGPCGIRAHDLREDLQQSDHHVLSVRLALHTLLRVIAEARSLASRTTKPNARCRVHAPFLVQTYDLPRSDHDLRCKRAGHAGKLSTRSIAEKLPNNLEQVVAQQGVELLGGQGGPRHVLQQTRVVSALEHCAVAESVEHVHAEAEQLAGDNEALVRPGEAHLHQSLEQVGEAAGFAERRHIERVEHNELLETSEGFGADINIYIGGNDPKHELKTIQISHQLL
mmetsp:Transcript_30276/g.80159  ORF Transcript_30276/g.80159 Transcript_30276/m.80159 type:complete len:224 (+) Transcript_30276:3025-3696(+)